MQYLDECSICGQKFEGNKFQKGTFRGKHIKLVHKSTYEQYIIDNFYNAIRPVCKCGCGKFPKFRRQFVKDSWFFDYCINHRPTKPHTQEHKDKIGKGCKKTMLERYGVENPMHIESSKENIKKTFIKNYGVDNPMQLKHIRDKCKNTMLKNHGVEHALQSNIIKEKFKATSIERFGVEHPFTSEIVKDKIKDTNQSRYGFDYYTSTEGFRIKSLKTLRDIYGVDNIMLIPYYKNKNLENSKSTRLLKYGVEYFLQLPNYKKLYCYNQKSKDELRVCEELGGESGFMFKDKEYDIRVENNLFEIDGDYYHSTNLLNLNIKQISAISNDFIKINDCKNSEYNLYKILVSNLPKEITIENLIKNSYIPNYSLSNDDVIMTKEYIEFYIERNGLKDLLKIKNKFLNIFKNFVPNLYNQYGTEYINNHLDYIFGVDDGIVKDFTINNILKLN